MELNVPKSEVDKPDNARPDFSVVVPMKNEAENIAVLLDGLALSWAGSSFEVILVDDGSTDATAAVIAREKRKYPWLRLVQHENSAGQSAAVHSGVLKARAAIICTLDGDGQNPPSEIPKLLAPFAVDATSGQLGLVAGQRIGRQDSWSKKAASKFANALRGYILSDKTRDTGCGLKAFRRDAFLELPYFNNMHRYLPALFSAYGWQVAHVNVNHAARHAGTSNYNNLQRGLAGIHDLIGVSWLIKRRKRARPVEAIEK
ncbi:MAG: glycosyltransferase family 2 protein [Halocynthiibacter sp.]